MAATYLPTIRQLQYLVALKEHDGFSRAADACHVSQSTLSMGIRDMETLLGTVLVERNRRTMSFTEIGDTVVEHARRLLREADDLADAVRSAGSPLTGSLHMTSIPTIAPFLLPRIMPKIRAAYPELKLYLREETSGDGCASLHAGRTDCLLLALPFECGDIATSKLFDDRMLVAFPPTDGPQPAGPVDAASIDPSRLLMLEDGHCLTGHALAACGLRSARGETAMLGTSLHTIVQMVDSGLGMTMLPEMAVDAGILEGTDIIARPLSAEHATREIALVWRKGNPREADFLLLAELLSGLGKQA